MNSQLHLLRRAIQALMTQKNGTAHGERGMRVERSTGPNPPPPGIIAWRAGPFLASTLRRSTFVCPSDDDPVRPPRHGLSLPQAGGVRRAPHDAPAARESRPAPVA